MLAQIDFFGEGERLMSQFRDAFYSGVYTEADSYSPDEVRDFKLIYLGDTEAYLFTIIFIDKPIAYSETTFKSSIVMIANLGWYKDGLSYQLSMYVPYSTFDLDAFIEIAESFATSPRPA